jgi:hypothetical protein
MTHRSEGRGRENGQLSGRRTTEEREYFTYGQRLGM